MELLPRRGADSAVAEKAGMVQRVRRVESQSLAGGRAVGTQLGGEMGRD